MNVPSFESVWVLWSGLPLSIGLFVWFVRRLRSVPRSQLWILLALRGAALVLLMLIASRPIWSSSEHDDPPRDHVVVLVDDSESMSLEGNDGRPRYAAAVEFARERLLPELREGKLRVKGMLFSEQPRDASGKEIAEARPTGKATNLARAILAAVTAGDRPPLAVIALTDGATTIETDNHGAVTALLENGVPLIGLGFGRDLGERVVTVQGIHAPARVPPNVEFRVEVSVRTVGEGVFPPLQLALLRDGKLTDRRTLKSFEGARLLHDAFVVKEEIPGRHRYTVQILPPSDSGLRLNHSDGTTMVTISNEDHWRILFVQGGLTWDYKFIQLAVRKDPALKITGLSRTSNESRFFQSAEVDDETLSGFPTTVEQLAEFRAVILANLKPADLQPSQQQLLVKYCGEYGGGLLMLGGGETFNVSWRDSALEQLLPVRFAGTPSGGLTRPFSLEPTSDGLRSPVFQIGGSGNPKEAWSRLPTFNERADVAAIKVGAEVWAVQGGQGGAGRPLIVSQRFGTGRTTAICVPNLWRWRLARESETAHFDRFWQQLLRFLGGGDVQSVTIHLVDPWLAPETDLHVVLERRPEPKGRSATASNLHQFVVQDADQRAVVEQQVALTPSRPMEVTFRVPTDGIYTLRVLDANKVEQANRMLEIKKEDREFARTSRDMEKLRQWAALSMGEAVAVEDCREVGPLIDRIRRRAAEAYQRRPVHKPAGINFATMLVLLGLLSAEWTLRRKWDWI